MSIIAHYNGSKFHLKSAYKWLAVKAIERYQRRELVDVYRRWLQGDADRKLWEYFRLLGFEMSFERPWDPNSDIIDLAFGAFGDTYYNGSVENSLQVIAKYVTAGSYMDFSDEDDGKHWRLFFNGDCMIEKIGRVVYD